jgi:hypothetical protein
MARSPIATAHPFHANHHGPTYTILRVGPGLNVGSAVVAWSYRERNVTYVVFEPDEGQTRPNDPLYNKEHLPSLLFYSAGAMTLFTLGLLWWLLPDLLRRTWLWLRGLRRYRLELAGMLRLPPSGPVILITDAVDAEARDHVERATDRVVRFVALEDDHRALGAVVEQVLSRGQVLGMSLGPDPGAADEQLDRETARFPSVPILPVHHAEVIRNGRRFVYVIAGALVAPGSPVALVRDELRRLAAETAGSIASGEVLEKEAVDH